MEILHSNLDDEGIKLFNKKFTELMMWGLPPDNRTDEEKYLDTLYMAHVYEKEGDKQYKSYYLVSSQDMKAYKFKGYYQPILPLEEVPYFKFDRWWREMDF